MNKAKFTPGPWMSIVPAKRHIHEGVDITTFNVYAEYEYFDDLKIEIKDIVINQFVGQHDFDEFVANAHLIAAAPEMYEMLDRILNDSMNTYNQDVHDIKHLLARARGES